MKVFLSVDAEGIGGVSSWHETLPKDPDFGRYRELATKEVNTVCETIRELYPKATIVVCDSHANGENLLIENLLEDIHLVKGFPRTYYMMEGIDKSFDAVIFIGYHSKVGSARGGMDHSYSSSSIYSVKVNGKEFGETELNAVYAGYYRVPLVLVAGDDVLVKSLRKDFPQIQTVETKKGISRFAAQHRPLNRIHSDLNKKTRLAFQNLKKIKPFFIKPPYNIEIQFNTTIHTDVACLIPQLKRVSGRSVRFKIKDYKEFYSMFMAIVMLCSTTHGMG